MIVEIILMFRGFETILGVCDAPSRDIIAAFLVLHGFLGAVFNLLLTAFDMDAGRKQKLGEVNGVAYYIIYDRP